MHETQLTPSGGSGPAGLLAQAGQLVDEAAQTMWAARPGTEMTATVESIATLRAKLDALELTVVNELDVSPTGQEALKHAGWASVKDYVSHTTGGRRGSGSGALRLARHLDDFPALAEALAAGRLSRVKAQIIAAAADKLPLTGDVRDQALSFLIDRAAELSAEDLERAGRHVLEVVDPDGVDAELERGLERTERAAHLGRELSIRFDRLGGGSGRFNGSKEDLLLLNTVLMSLAAPQPSEPGACGGEAECTSKECKLSGHSGRDPREHGIRMFDALVELARIGQATGALPEAHGAVPQLMVTMDWDDLLAGANLMAPTTLGEDLDPATVRRLACDCGVLPVALGGEGIVLDVGRTQRLVTPAIWTALVARDRHCAFPGCRRPPVMCHAHHILHWVDDGTTCLDNLVMLCGTHHRLIHSTPWEVRLAWRDRRPEFRPPDRPEWIRDRGGTDPPVHRRSAA